MSGNRNIPRALNNRISRREQEVVSMNTSMAPCTDSSRVELVVDVLGQFGEARLVASGSSRAPDGRHCQPFVARQPHPAARARVADSLGCRLRALGSGLQALGALSRLSTPSDSPPNVPRASRVKQYIVR